MERTPQDPVSRVAHQLRTPLTVIMSTVNNLLDGAFGPLAPDQRKWIEKLAPHAAAIEVLSNEILELLRARSEGQVRGTAMAAEHVAGALQPPRVQAVDLFNWKRNPRVLVVDDEPDIRDVIKEGLEMKGFDTICASSGEEAMELAIKNSPDLILMDYLLRQANGVEVCRAIKGKLNGFVPVLLVTGQNQVRDALSGQKNDPDDILAKPFQLPELYSRVTSMLRIKKLYDDLTSFEEAA